MRLLAVAVNFAIFASIPGCNVTSADRGGRSEVTSITVGLPDRTPLKARVPDIETKMNAYHLWVTPTDANCVGATKINLIGDYKVSADVLDFKLAQGCDYEVVLSLGNKAAAPTTTDTSKLAATYYQNVNSYRISKESIQGVSSVSADISVQLTTDGKGLGL